MPTEAEKVAAGQQRQRIPTEVLVELDRITNESLLFLSNGSTGRLEWRVYAGWELEYREAFGVVVSDMVKTKCITCGAEMTLHRDYAGNTSCLPCLRKRAPVETGR